MNILLNKKKISNFTTDSIVITAILFIAFLIDQLCQPPTQSLSNGFYSAHRLDNLLEIVPLPLQAVFLVHHVLLLSLADYFCTANIQGCMQCTGTLLFPSIKYWSVLLVLYIWVYLVLFSFSQRAKQSERSSSVTKKRSKKLSS